MIKNERQYRSAKSQAERLAETLKILEHRRGHDVTSDPLLDAQVSAVRGERRILRSQIAEYESLVTGQRPFLQLRALSDLPRVLIEARIASGMTQADLAARLGLKEQQIQRYEATDYSGTSIGRLAEIAAALEIHLPSTLQIATVPRPWLHVATHLERLGLERNFIRKRLLPARGIGAGESGGSEASHWERLAEPIARILGVSVEALVREAPLHVDPIPLATARFKLASRYSHPRTAVYALYAHHLATIVAGASETACEPLPDDWTVVVEALAGPKGEVSLESALSFLWSRGTVVIPLSDSGSFHAAFWRVDGRNVIILKQRTRSAARWLFDLLHEYYHAAQEPTLATRSVIDGGDPLSAYRDDPEESEASMFAGQVLLAGRAETLAEFCEIEAAGSVERLKGAVKTVSRREGVSTGVLANYLAYRLSLQDINWWGAASNLQEETVDPWLIARDFLLSHIDTRRLERGERDLLERALRE
jgi:Predicted transcription factor, homolog of eukaryotic MBF1